MKTDKVTITFIILLLIGIMIFMLYLKAPWQAHIPFLIMLFWIPAKNLIKKLYKRMRARETTLVERFFKPIYHALFPNTRNGYN